jgi:PadR family transcriptional regulator PadR
MIALSLEGDGILMASKNLFTTGVTELLFLSILEQRDSYVYDITSAIEQRSGGLLQISPNTIYAVAYKLEQDGMVSERSVLVGRKRTRIYYHLEPEGQVYLKMIAEQYRQVNQGVALFFQQTDAGEQENAHE